MAILELPSDEAWKFSGERIMHCNETWMGTYYFVRRMQEGNSSVVRPRETKAKIPGA